MANEESTGASIESRVSHVEGIWVASKWWAGVALILVLAWFGVTSFVQIPALVKESLQDQGVKAAMNTLNDLSAQFQSARRQRIEAGEVSVEFRKQREVGGDVAFSPPFERPPIVVMNEYNTSGEWILVRTLKVVS